MVYSAILPVADCLVEEELHGGTYSLEPSKVFNRLPRAILDLDIPIVVRLSDGEESMEFNLQGFLMRSYKVRNGLVRIGTKRFKLNQLSISCGIKFLVEDLSNIVHTDLD